MMQQRGKGCRNAGFGGAGLALAPLPFNLGWMAWDRITWPRGVGETSVEVTQLIFQVQKIRSWFKCVIQWSIAFPTDPVLPNSVFRLPIYQFVNLIDFFPLLCNNGRRLFKGTLEITVLLHF
jgi:hypothetical protein